MSFSTNRIIIVDKAYFLFWQDITKGTVGKTNIENIFLICLSLVNNMALALCHLLTLASDKLASWANV